MKPQASQEESARLADKSFNRSIAISILCILLCAAALCSTSWAWFSDSVSSQETIVTATCTVTATVQDSESVVLLPDGEGNYLLSADVIYTVELVSEGTAQSSYGALTVGGTRYYTEQISTTAPDNTLRFTLSFTSDTVVHIKGYWGTLGREERDLLNGAHYLDMQETTPHTPLV